MTSRMESSSLTCIRGQDPRKAAHWRSAKRQSLHQEAKLELFARSSVKPSFSRIWPAQRCEYVFRAAACLKTIHNKVVGIRTHSQRTVQKVAHPHARKRKGLVLRSCRTESPSSQWNSGKLTTCEEIHGGISETLGRRRIPPDHSSPGETAHSKRIKSLLSILMQCSSSSGEKNLAIDLPQTVLLKATPCKSLGTKAGSYSASLST